MHKIWKKTIKYGGIALLILIATIMIGMSYLYLSADMMTPQFASTPETDRVIRKDSLRQYGGNYLRHSESGLWELKVSGPAYERGEAIGKLTSDLLYFQEKVFVDQIKEIVPSESYLKFLRFLYVQLVSHSDFCFCEVACHLSAYPTRSHIGNLTGRHKVIHILVQVDACLVPVYRHAFLQLHHLAEDVITQPLQGFFRTC